MMGWGLGLCGSGVAIYESLPGYSNLLQMLDAVEVERFVFEVGLDLEGADAGIV